MITEAFDQKNINKQRDLNLIKKLTDDLEYFNNYLNKALDITQIKKEKDERMVILLTEKITEIDTELKKLKRNFKRNYGVINITITNEEAIYLANLILNHNMPKLRNKLLNTDRICDINL